MSKIKRLKETVGRVVVPIILASLVTFAFFTFGFRMGAERQLEMDGPLIEQCVSEIKDFRSRTDLVESQPCSFLCDAISASTEGQLPISRALRAPSGECVCFFGVPSDE